MRAISLKQPWANLIASGDKTIETRKWSTSWRGDLLICSSKKPDIPPTGMALCIVRVVGCRLMRKEDEKASCCEVYDGAFAWLLADLRRIEPFPVRGSLGLFEVDLPKGLLG